LSSYNALIGKGHLLKKNNPNEFSFREEDEELRNRHNFTRIQDNQLSGEEDGAYEQMLTFGNTNA